MAVRMLSPSDSFGGWRKTLFIGHSLYFILSQGVLIDRNWHDKGGNTVRSQVLAWGLDLSVGFLLKIAKQAGRSAIAF